MIGHVRLDQLKPSDVTRLMLHVQDAGKAASTRRNCYAALGSALDDAVANGLLAANPVTRVKRPRADHVEATSLSVLEVTRLLEGAADLREGPKLIADPTAESWEPVRTTPIWDDAYYH